MVEACGRESGHRNQPQGAECPGKHQDESPDADWHAAQKKGWGESDSNLLMCESVDPSTGAHAQTKASECSKPGV